MISSMTGFGVGHSGTDDAEFTVELRSVNHKASDIKVRIPYDLSLLEGDLVKRVKERVQRGSVDVVVKRPKSTGTGPVALSINTQLAEEYLSTAWRLADVLGLERKMDLRSVLSFDGVLLRETIPPNLEELRKPLFEALDQALDALVLMRRNEGAALEEDLRRRLAYIQERVNKVRELSPQTVENYRRRLDERIAELTKGISLDPQRLAQEVAVFADRVDVAEEVTRLDTHLKAFDGMLSQSGAIGRSMDFLIQEINRETNTIGSKSQSADIAALVVEMKAEIERIREQVQNIL